MDNPTFLSLSGPDAIAGMVYEALGPTSNLTLLLQQWTQPTFDPSVPSVTFVSQPFSTSSLVGQYVGQMTFKYLQRNLFQIFPMPLVYRDPYPTTFVKLQTYFKKVYNVQLDDGEFVLGSGTTPLSTTDAVNMTPDPVSGLIVLKACSTSLRFVQWTPIYILPIHPSVPVPMARLFTLDGDLWTGTLTDHLNPPV